MLRSFLLKELQVMVSIGVYAAERTAPQRVLIDAELYLYPSSEPTDDQVHSTLNYDLIRETIRSEEHNV